MIRSWRRLTQYSRVPGCPELDFPANHEKRRTGMTRSLIVIFVATAMALLPVATTIAATCDKASLSVNVKADCSLEVDVRLEPFIGCGAPLPGQLELRIFSLLPSSQGGAQVFQAGTGCEWRPEWGPVFRVSGIAIGSIEAFAEVWINPGSSAVSRPCDNVSPVFVDLGRGATQAGECCDVVDNEMNSLVSEAKAKAASVRTGASGIKSRVRSARNNASSAVLGAVGACSFCLRSVQGAVPCGVLCSTPWCVAISTLQSAIELVQNEQMLLSGFEQDLSSACPFPSATCKFDQAIDKWNELKGQCPDHRFDLVPGFLDEARALIASTRVRLASVNNLASTVLLGLRGFEAVMNALLPDLVAEGFCSNPPQKARQTHSQVLPEDDVVELDIVAIAELESASEEAFFWMDIFADRMESIEADLELLEAKTDQIILDSGESASGRQPPAPCGAMGMVAFVIPVLSFCVFCRRRLGRA